MKVLLERFHVNGNTIGFYPQTQKLEPAPSRSLNLGIKVKEMFWTETFRFNVKWIVSESACSKLHKTGTQNLRAADKQGASWSL